MNDMNKVRKATSNDISRIAEMIVINYRINFFPFFHNESFYFSELNVINVAENFNADILQNTYVHDDGIVKGMMLVSSDELVKLYVEPQFQSCGIGAELLDYAVKELQVSWLWALEYNKRGISFYKKHGFELTGERVIEDEWIPLLKMSLLNDMSLRKMSIDSPDKLILERINSNSFEREQSTSIDDLFQSDKGDLDILGIYHSDTLVGFFSVRRYKTIAYLGYFAIAKEHRCKDFGSRALNLLKYYYENKQIVIEIESIHEKCDNMENRIRRRNFYLKNGMISTDWYIYYDNVELEIICSDKNLRKNEFEEITKQIHLLYYDFIPKMYKKKYTNLP